MKLIILLAVAALSSGAKLDRTYLPPSYAQTSGGNGQFLDAPNFQNNDFTQATSNGFSKSNDLRNSDNYQNNDYVQNGNNYAQNENYPQNDGGFGQANGFIQNDGELESFNDFNQRPERPQAAIERSAAILRQDNRNDGETYAYAYETSNGIIAEENGEATDGVKAQGGYSYTGDDGQVYSVRYTADENGFLPQGDHLPTPPPIPEEILLALEKNAQDEANGIFDDGSYSDGKYDDGEQNNEAGYNYNNNGINFNAGGEVNNAFADVSADDDDDSVVTNNALLRSNNAAQSGFGNQNGVQKAYLPPFQQNGQRSQASPNGRYNTAQNNGLRNQGNNVGLGSRNGVEKAYLPPQPFQQNTRRTQNGLRNQGNGFNGQNGVERAYLPPQQFEQNAQAGANARFNPAQNNGFRNQPNNGFNGQNGVEKAYLPPQQFGQRNQESSRASNGQNGVNRAYLPPGQFEQRDQNVAAKGRFTPQGNAAIRNQSSKLERAYLPPSSLSQGQTRRSQGFKSIGLARRTNVSREYLPPSDQRRSGFDSNAVFNNNNEYQF